MIRLCIHVYIPYSRKGGVLLVGFIDTDIGGIFGESEQMTPLSVPKFTRQKTQLALLLVSERVGI